ncbi:MULTISPECIES: hypothetical protein [unclassified Streptomyces]|uniref:hypothetical protein n=1 Tax=unclassified Streptomyces TaxID=2593676 RepID=UPI002E2B71BB|nr:MULTISPECIES: hypothetical protein [unclassified Streptomyces]
MRIEILDVLDNPAETQGSRIAFRGPLGQAWARWRGSAAPHVGDTVDVEIDIPDDVVRWVHTEGPDALLAEAAGAPVRIQGTVIAADEDAVVSIRLGTDVLLVEFAAAEHSEEQGRRFMPSIDDRIELSVPHIDVYPYSV